MGSGSSIGQALAESPKVHAISFTGSYDVGLQIAGAAAKNLTKFQLELGSKNPLVVMDDADIDVAVAAATGGAFGSTGQKCTASSRLVVHASIHDEFVDRMSQSTSALKVGHALEEGTQIGPAASQQQLDSNLKYMALAKEEGCEIVCGGQKLELDNPGFYMQPALLVGGNNSMRVNREELFAPMACVIKVADYDEALSVANDTDFGLVSGIITQSLSRAITFVEMQRAVVLWLTCQQRELITMFLLVVEKTQVLAQESKAAMLKNCILRLKLLIFLVVIHNGSFITFY